jgi:hypothetical protein
MSAFLGSSSASFYIGSTQVSKIYLGTNLVYPQLSGCVGSSGLLGTRHIGYFEDDTSWFNTAQLHGDTNCTTSIDNFTSSSNSNEDSYSWQWNGYFKANSTETYTFYTSSDDASYLWIGVDATGNYTPETAVVNNGGLHGMQEASGTTPLVSGQYYPIRIQFGENTGGDAITVNFSTDTITKTTDGSGYYFNQII